MKREHQVAPQNEHELEASLSLPDTQTVRALGNIEGDVLVLGAGGKMGPTLARMARRALDDAGQRERRVIAVSRFSDAVAARELETHGIVVHRADLSDAQQVRAIPFAPNVIWMAGQKFGTSGDPVATWKHNVLASAYAAEHFGGARVVCFSTGNVYGRSDVAHGGSREGDTLMPDGEYAASCIGRERMFEAVSRRANAPLLLFRLFYACDLRYGVVTDVAVRIVRGEPIPLDTAWANVIWQGDANRLALRSLAAAVPGGVAVNVTGRIESIEAIAHALGERLGRAPMFSGSAGSEALVANVDRLRELMPYDALPLETLIEWTAEWVQRGGRLLNKPTKYEVSDGRF